MTTADHSPEDTLQKIEAAVLSLVLTRISLRGRMRVEEDLQQLEKLVGELPEVRAQLNGIFGVDTTPTLPALASAEPSPRRPGRPPKKDRDESAPAGP